MKEEIVNTRLDVFKKMFGSEKPIIGMIHLKPLPGSPLYDGSGLSNTIECALEDAEMLLNGGVNGLEVENYGDASYFPDTAPPDTIASLSIVAHEIRKGYPETILGICLLSDPMASIAIAHSVKAQFIRATFFTEASVDVSGLVLRRPHEILRYRKFLDPSIKIFADVHIKHAAPLAYRPIEESAYDAAYFLADAVIVSGKHTGFPTNVEDVKKVKTVLPDEPVLIGSGTRLENVEELLSYADGAIVGTSFKVDGVSVNPVDVQRTKAFMSKVKEIIFKRGK
jgi:membrane complex biogenesis BtpA family protein